MAVNFPMLVYLPCYQVFARPVIITPLASQPGAPPYSARGIFDTDEDYDEAFEGSKFSDTRTILDILETEFPVLPMQDDLISIPPHEMIRGGDFIVTDKSIEGNAGGEVTLYLKRIHLPKLVGTALVLRAPWFGRPRLGRKGIIVRPERLVLEAPDLARPLLEFANALLPVVAEFALAAPEFARPQLLFEAGVSAGDLVLLAPAFADPALTYAVNLAPIASDFVLGRVSATLTTDFVVPPPNATAMADVDDSSEFHLGQVIYIDPIGWFEITGKG